MLRITAIALVPCSARRPVVGEQVMRQDGESRLLNDKDGKEDAWVLFPGEISTVSAVDRDGDFCLRNPRGVESCWTFRDLFCYCQEAQMQQEAAIRQQQAEDEQRRQMMAQQAIPDDQGMDMPSAPGSAQAGQRPAADAGYQPSPEQIAAQAEAMLGQQGGEDMAQQRPERPRTAGRKPPKVTSKVKTTSDEPGLTQGVAPPTIIAEGARDDDDEDMFEAPVQQSLAGMPVKADDNAQHGKLVNDLLAAKKVEEDKERLRKEEEDTREEVEEPGTKGIKMGKLKRKKDTVGSYTEIDTAKLSESIQQLCQAANPLGKSIDLVHQDIANMGKELDQWKQQYREASEQYQTELKMTDEVLQPLYQKIAELDDRVAEQKTKIRNSRSRISKNDLKIQGLLESVVMAK